MTSSPSECILVYNLKGLFTCARIVSRKARERELAALDEKNRRAVMGLLNPMRAMKIEGNMNRGGRRDYTCDHGLSRRSWKVDVCEEKKEKEKKTSSK